MKKLILLFTILFVITIAASIGAEIKTSGDLRVRPRIDIKNNGIFGDKTTDGYYYYRARLNFNSELGDGWYGHIQLGTNGFGYFTGKFADPSASGASKPIDFSVDGASRGPVDFMLAYFGRKTTQYGYMGGLMPINGLANPMLDIHYYSDQMVDVPFFLFSNNGAYGFSGYLGFKNGSKVNAAIFVDNNEGSKKEDSTGVLLQDIVDQYTIMLDAPLKLSGFTIQPTVLFTAISQSSTATPFTYGLNVTTPKIKQFTIDGSFGISSQNNNGITEYTAWYSRAKVVGKIGLGTLTAWYDLANKTFELPTGDKEHDFGYLWLSYTIPVYKSDNGSISIKPTWRHITEQVNTNGIDSKDYMRDKLEVTIDYSFK